MLAISIINRKEDMVGKGIIIRRTWFRTMDGVVISKRVVVGIVVFVRNHAFIVFGICIDVPTLGGMPVDVITSDTMYSRVPSSMVLNRVLVVIVFVRVIDVSGTLVVRPVIRMVLVAMLSSSELEVGLGVVIRTTPIV